MTEEQVKTGSAILKRSAKKIFTSGLSPYVSTDGTTEKIYLDPAIAKKLYSMLEADCDRDIQKYEEELKSL